MKINTYPTLAALILSACTWRHGEIIEGKTSGDTGYETGEDSAYDSSSFDTAEYDTGFVDSGLSDSGALDTSIDSGALDTGYSPLEWCASSTVPESVPWVRLLPSHYALVDSDEYFETNTGSRSEPVIEDSSYTITDTYGCSCERILECKNSSRISEEYAFGCTEGTMQDWIDQRGWAASCE